MPLPTSLRRRQHPSLTPLSKTPRACGSCAAFDSPLFEIALVLVSLDHFARFVVNADHRIM
jgi:hypothetical protein